MASLPPPPEDVGEMTVEEALPLFEDALYSVGLSEKTIKSYLAAVRDFSSHAGNPRISSITSKMITSWIRSRLDRGFPHESRNTRADRRETRRRRQATLHYYTLFLRRFLEWAGRPRRLVPVVRKPTSPEPRVLQEEDIDRLLEASRDLMDVLIVSLLYETGLRSSELLSLRVRDVDLERGEVVVRSGKYGKRRIVFLGPLSKKALEAYLPGKRPHDPVIPLTYNALYKRLKTLAKRAGLEHYGLRPHVLRHTFATNALRKGMSLIALQKLLGHSDVKITQIYTHLLTEDLRREYEKIFAPTSNSPPAPTPQTTTPISVPAPPPVRASPPPPSPPQDGGAGGSGGMRYCFNCGAPLPPGARFCASCGIRLDALYRPSSSVGETA